MPNPYLDKIKQIKSEVISLQEAIESKQHDEMEDDEQKRKGDMALKKCNSVLTICSMVKKIIR